MSKAILNKSIAQKDPNLVFPVTEKVIQFGTGVLLRGLTDYFIHNVYIEIARNVFNNPFLFYDNNEI